MEHGFNPGHEDCSDMTVDNYNQDAVVSRLGALMQEAHNVKQTCDPSDLLPHDLGNNIYV